jgi:hypothetical protein
MFSTKDGKLPFYAAGKARIVFERMMHRKAGLLAAD